ncbi:MAG: S8 family serine peptidase [Lachnospiraceae bacterium]|nr:S8 family serine peptidase [Lachnospiraceae bacterium]
MDSQKAENELNLALDASEEERERALGLGEGYDPEEQTWELIVKYSGSVERLRALAEQATELSGGYAILIVRESMLSALEELPEVEYIEKPRRLYFAQTEGKRASCMSAVQRAPLRLTGRGVIVAVLDSGVDCRHPDFRKEDGTSRILALWDQTGEGLPPEGFHAGTEYTREELNGALRRDAPLPGDSSGHGTGVLSITAGNRGVAFESELLVVKLAAARENGFPRTTELMLGIEYVIRKAQRYGMPLALNLSFGNSYGSHTGKSLLETYIDEVSRQDRTVICAGSGNEGTRAGHAAGNLRGVTGQRTEISVAAYEPSLNLQVWKNYADRFDIYLVHPQGLTAGPLHTSPPAQRYLLGETELLVYYGEPRPYSVNQEIFIEWIPKGSYLDAGIWSLRFVPKKIVDGSWQMWLPSGGVVGSATRFLTPSPENTLTIPSTASGVITVGAYDDRTDALADFSGRGQADSGLQKPDLVAPGVEITAAAPGGAYQSRSGTSFAVPFVTGAAALLMQHGIVDGHDRYLYGEKVKAYLRSGARPLPAFSARPNVATGYGKLCVEDSLGL